MSMLRCVIGRGRYRSGRAWALAPASLEPMPGTARGPARGDLGEIVRDLAFTPTDAPFKIPGGCGSRA
jgi:hypothetical protein